MPARDGTGPMGMGPMTGRAAGYCAGHNVPGFANPAGGRRFAAFGRAAYYGGFGRGAARFGRARGRGGGRSGRRW